MAPLWLRVRAPFAAFRPFQAGAFRATAPVMTPTAAYGLILNLAGIETRDPTPAQTTRTRKELPPLRLAIGLESEPVKASLYQQLHVYPVGNSGQEFRERTHGAKYWITPVRRELLVGLDAVVGVEGPREVVDRIGPGLRGELKDPRYGLPFAGDNNFLFDRIDLLLEPPPARWLVEADEAGAPVRNTCRLTVGIDREDSSRSRSELFAIAEAAAAVPPASAWIEVPQVM